MTYKIETLFPTSILTTNINRPFTKEELDVCSYHSNYKTHNQGLSYYSNNRTILDTELHDIRKIVEHYIGLYSENIMCVKDNIQFYITQSWFNYADKNTKQITHRHPNSILSGVVYFQAKDNEDMIMFHKHDWDSKQIMIVPKQYNYYNSDTWWLPVKTGDIVIFPSDLAHSVPSVTTETTRISLAFNVFAKGVFGDDSFLTTLHL
jgi:uncharacterized protein (TIGR02466 family)